MSDPRLFLGVNNSLIFIISIIVMHCMMTTSGDIIRLIPGLRKAGYIVDIEGEEDLERKIEAIIEKELEHLKNSARSPFMQESKLREVISLHKELMKGSPPLYRLLAKLHNWVQYECYRSPDSDGYHPQRAA